jgi:hypothetical protein
MVVAVSLFNTSRAPRTVRVGDRVVRVAQPDYEPSAAHSDGVNVVVYDGGLLGFTLLQRRVSR